MAKFCGSISKLLLPISSKLSKPRPHDQSLAFTISCFKVRAAAASSPSSNKDEIPQHVKRNLRKAPRAPRRLITISTSDGRWHSQWSCDYMFSLRELQLADLAEDGQANADVFVSLSIQKMGESSHPSTGNAVAALHHTVERLIPRLMFGFYLQARAASLSYLKLVEVIYVKPGSEADLDSLIKDTLRLTASAKDTCSESCEKSAVIWQYTDGRRSYDQRWSRLLEIKKKM